MTSFKTDRRSIGYVPSIDGLRGLAVLWIVAGHCWTVGGGMLPPLRGPLTYIFGGYLVGVDLLFVASGFVLFLPVATHNGSIGNIGDYAFRRAARILPGFYVFLLFSYFVARYVGMAHGGAGAWLANAFFVHQESLRLTDNGFGVNQAMWTMSVEVIFYVALPFVAARYHRRPFAGLGVAFAIAVAWQLVARKIDVLLGRFGVPVTGIDQVKDRLAHSFPSYTAHFALGMTAAYVFVRANELGLRRSWRSLVPAAASAALIGLTAVAYLVGWRMGHGMSGLEWQGLLIERAVLFGTLILAVTLGLKRARVLVTNSISRLLGRVSYGVYLSHMPLIYLLSKVLGIERTPLGLLTLTACVVPLSIGMGIVSMAFIEEPARAWARRVRRPVTAGRLEAHPPLAPVASR